MIRTPWINPRNKRKHEKQRKKKHMSDLFGGLYQGDVDETTIPEAGYGDNPPDGVYEATVTDIYAKEGSQKDPSARFLMVEYTLSDTGETKTELFGMPKDPSRPTDDERKKLGYYVNRLRDFGVPRDAIQTTNRETLIGLDVVITLRTKGQYQNVNRVDLVAGTNEAAPQEPARQEPARQSSPPGGATLGAQRTQRQRPNQFAAN